MSSKIEKLQAQIADARKRRSAEVSKLQELLSNELTKASKKGKKNAPAASDESDT